MSFENKAISDNTMAKRVNTNDRVSPTSIIDYPFTGYATDSPEKDDHLSSSFDCIMELNQLHHPLASMEALTEESTTNIKPMISMSSLDTMIPLSSSIVILKRICTPHDTVTLSSYNDDCEKPNVDNDGLLMTAIDYVDEISVSQQCTSSTDVFVHDTSIIESEYNIDSTNDICVNKFNWTGIGPFRRFRSSPVRPKSSEENCTKTMIGIEHEESIHTRSRPLCIVTCVNLVPILKKKSTNSRKASTTVNVSFCETMQVRYFYRNEDEIAIMKQCAMERRLQQELRRSMRRRLRKAKQRPVRTLFGLSSNHFSNSLTSFFTGSLTGCRDNIEIVDDDDDYYDNPTSKFNTCGLHFERYDVNGDDGDFIVLNEDHQTQAVSPKFDYSEQETTLFPQVPSSGSGNEPETNITSNSILHDFLNGLSAIVHGNDVFSNRLVGHQDISHAIISDQLDGTQSMPKTVPEQTIDEVEPWTFSALSCGEST
jgi:hypothetical protein